MRHVRSLTVTAVVAVVSLIVLSADAVVGPPEPPPRPTARTVSGDPVAGTSVCSVGLGPAASPLDLPELERELEQQPEELLEDEPTDPDEQAEPETPDETQDDASEPVPDPEQGLPDGEAGPTGPVSATLITARPGRAGAPPADLDVSVLVEGERSRLDLPDVFPGADVRTTPDALDAPGAVEVQWRGGPAVTTREWRLEGLDELPDAVVAGGCAQASAESHIIPGMSTAGGDEARLRLINPFESDAAVAVAFATPAGREEPVALRNVSVPARSVREIAVNETLPERDDLAAVVAVAAGRVAVEGLQVSRAAIGGVDGATLLGATTEPAEEWTVPWVVDDAPTEEPEPEQEDADDADDADDGETDEQAGDEAAEEPDGVLGGADAAASWLWIHNPSERTASVELTLHTADGGEVPVGLAEVSIGPDELRRIELSGTLPEGTAQAAITARSNGVPIVVSAAAQITADDAERTGVAVQLGSAPDGDWVVSAAGEGDREEQLWLVNPGSEPAVADVRLFNGVAVVRPPQLQGVEVPAGSSRRVDLTEPLGDAERWSAFVSTSRSEVVVGRVGHDIDGPLRLTAVPGVPARSWAAADSGLTAVFGDGLSRRLGTGDGPDAGPSADDADTAPGFGDPDPDSTGEPEAERSGQG